MSEKHFVIVLTDFDEPVDSDEFTATLNKAVDWIQFTPTSWLLWTTSSSEKWYARMKKYTKPGNRLFICEVNLDDRSGFMPKSFWDFVNRKRTEHTS
jgi:hypothetical protein